MAVFSEMFQYLFQIIWHDIAEECNLHRQC